MTDWNSPEPPAVIDRLRHAWNQYDLNALAACFHANYESMHPLHAERNFWGRAEACRSWGLLFDAIPDFRSELLRCSTAGDVVWTEWRWSGHHKDGGAFRAGGVMILGLAGDEIGWARAYSETLETAGPDWESVLEEVLLHEAA